ncbi:plasmid pRiA4b ORF-3 family protein, partial [Candidatus Aerophobetes bacterium]|nr:plasmid pRiA4b ORF-3 family protein [Candidatus Aerophobetes bacterium]
FFEAFAEFFPKEELQKTLHRKAKKLVKGTFIFKVSLGKSWRKIAISGEDTLDDLQTVINDAFGFDFDHLYAFFMDGKRWSHNAINAPGCDEGPYTDDFCIGELNLSPGQEFLYLFDFGDECCFWVKLEKIKDDEIGLSKAKVIESKGEAPEQYPSWEDEEDWEE